MNPLDNQCKWCRRQGEDMDGETIRGQLCIACAALGAYKEMK